MKNTGIIATCIVTAFFITCSLKAKSQADTCLYAFIEMHRNSFNDKIRIDVDLSDTPEQIKTGKEYTELLTNKKSYAAILNFMEQNQFKLVQSLVLTENVQGSGGSSGMVFIMRKKK